MNDYKKNIVVFFYLFNLFESLFIIPISYNEF